MVVTHAKTVINFYLVVLFVEMICSGQISQTYGKSFIHLDKMSGA